MTISQLLFSFFILFPFTDLAGQEKFESRIVNDAIVESQKDSTIVVVFSKLNISGESFTYQSEDQILSESFLLKIGNTLTEGYRYLEVVGNGCIRITKSVLTNLPRKYTFDWFDTVQSKISQEVVLPYVRKGTVDSVPKYEIIRSSCVIEYEMNFYREGKQFHYSKFASNDLEKNVFGEANVSDRNLNFEYNSSLLVSGLFDYLQSVTLKNRQLYRVN